MNMLRTNLTMVMKKHHAVKKNESHKKIEKETVKKTYKKTPAPAQPRKQK